MNAPDGSRGSRYAEMQKSELEELAVSAIRKHRELLTADELVYEEWVRANDDPSISASVMQTLQNEYLARQKASEAQQNELSEIIDVLGYVPKVGAEGQSEKFVVFRHRRQLR